jgi:hypothetical protein
MQVPQKVRLNPKIKMFLEELIPIMQEREMKTMLSRNKITELFLETCGSSGMSLTNIKKQITVGMNATFPKWKDSKHGSNGCTWIIGGNLR